MRFRVILLLAPTACGSATDRAPSVAVVDVSAPRGTHVEHAPLPARDAPLPPPERDPFDDYVGRWSGLVNGSVDTELVVERSGWFSVRAPATSWRGPCDLSGRFRAGRDVVWMDVEKSSCSVVDVGTTLERPVLSKTEGEFTVQSPDGSLTIRYTRQP